MIDLMRKVDRLFSVLLLIPLLGFTSDILGQTTKTQKPSTCEEVRNAYDQSITSSISSEQRRVILIFRQGSRESSRLVFESQSRGFRKHARFRGADLSRFVFAQGERVVGLGKLEIFVEGKLTWELYASRGVVFGSDCLSESF